MKRTLVIGDIHGGLKALTQAFDRAAVTNADSLIFLGDYVDGWSESAQVIDFILNLAEKQTTVFIKGNHDYWCGEWLHTGVPNPDWLYNGGDTTIKSYRGKTAAEKQAHLRFFEKMNYYFIDDKNRLFVHAGFTSPAGPTQEKELYRLYWDRTLWETALSLQEKEKDHSGDPELFKLFGEIYIGHTPTLYFGVDTPMHACNVWNMDTGAAITGKLSIMDIDTKAFWQSDKLAQIYVGERGRN